MAVNSEMEVLAVLPHQCSHKNLVVKMAGVAGGPCGVVHLSFDGWPFSLSLPVRV